jgi:hypothetical protein
MLAPQVRVIWPEEVAAVDSVTGTVGTELQVPPAGMPVTVSATELLRTTAPGLVTATLKVAPLSVATVAGVV